MPKPEFDFNQFVEEATGAIIIAIGRGEFKQSLRAHFVTLAYERYEAGRKAGLAEAKKK